MRRREFLKASAAIGAATAATVAPTAVVAGPKAAEKHSFKLKYAPHFNMFKHSAGDDLIDQLKFASDQGFTAWEDNGMKPLCSRKCEGAWGKSCSFSNDRQGVIALAVAVV